MWYNCVRMLQGQKIMEKTSSDVDIRTIKNFPIDNPNAKIVKDGRFLRVVEREYYWNKEKQRGLERRHYLGYIIDNVYYDTESYKKHFKRNGARRLVPVADKAEAAASSAPSALEMRTAGELPLYYAIAQKTGLLEDLIRVWGEDRANAVLSLAFHWLNTSFNAAYLFDSWSEDKLLPYNQRLTGKEVTELFRSLVAEPARRKTFFGARLDRLPEDELLSFDATEIASEAVDITDAQFGKGKEGGFQSQIGLIVLLGQKSRMPVLFRILPGNITDVSTVPDMLFRFDEIADKKRVFAAVLDRGYCSLDNIARFCDANARIVMAAKIGNAWVREAMETAMSSLWMNSNRIVGQPCWGTTVPMELECHDGNKRKVWVHVYRSDMMSHNQNEQFYAKLDGFESQWTLAQAGDSAVQKSPLMKFYNKVNGRLPEPGRDQLVRNDDAIDAEVRYFGFFCNVTTFECAAKDALLDYQMRDSIEKSFKAGKTYSEMDVVRTHSNATIEGRFIVSFCCMTILNELYRRMREETTITTKKGEVKVLAPLAKEMTFNQIRNYLSSIRVVYDSDGHCRWQEITKRQRQIAVRLGLPGVYDAEPSWTTE